MADKKKTIENIKTILLIAVLIFFVMIAVFQMYDMAGSGNTGNRIVLGLNSATSDEFGSALKGCPVPMDDLVGIVTGGNFNIVDKNANVKTEETFMLSDPVLHAKGNYCIAADYGSNTARLYKNGKVQSEVRVEGEIISVVTNANGFFAVATEETGYNAVITVHRKNGEAIYRYRIADKTLIDMDISANNRKLVVCEANLDAGTIGSTVTVVEFNREDAQSVFYVKSTLYVGVHFNKNGSFVCLGNDRVDIYRSDGIKSGEILFDGRRLVAADITTDDMICLAFDSVGDSISGVATMEIYDKNAKMRGSIVFEDDIEHVCVNGSVVSVAHGDKLDIVKSNGKIKKTFENTSPIKYGAPFAGGNAAVIFSGGNTVIVK